MRWSWTCPLLAVFCSSGCAERPPIGDPVGEMDGAGDADDESDGNDGHGNAAACDDLEDKLSDCVPGLEGALSCSEYEDYACNLADYFNCINDAYGECDAGTFPDIDVDAVNACVPLAGCD